MNKLLITSAALALTASGALAGGLDRSGQGIGAIYETGDYVEMSFGFVSPNVTGTSTLLGPANSGNIAGSYAQLGMAYKTDVNESLALGLIMDQPFGANVDYSDGDPNYALTAAPGGTVAEMSTFGITALAKYKVSPNFSVVGGLRGISAKGDVSAAAINPAFFGKSYGSSTGAGYVVGAAYEKPEIALRVALTYSSAVDIQLTDAASGSTLDAKLPQSVNLDFQTGIAANTLLFGTIRWADWSESSLIDGDGNALLEYDNDAITYSIGVGRKFTETFSGAITIGYEAASGELAGDFAPTDGNYSLGLGGTFDLGDGVKVTGGVRYIQIGDATTDSAVAGVFEDNSALALGVKVAYSF